MQPWVLAAKRLAVGQSKRFRCCGSTPAAVIFNNTDSYSMYCHRCKGNHYERKKYVVLNPVTQVNKMSLEIPQDSVPISSDYYIEYLVFNFLHTKNMALAYFPNNINITYSPKAKRVIFNDAESGVVLGRYIPNKSTDEHPCKWVNYESKTPYAIVHKGVNPTTIILTEDYFSAIKVAFALRKSDMNYDDFQVIANLGTGISKALRAYIASASFKHGICMFDGDKAGYAGAFQFHKRLRVFCEKISNCIHNGLDPKDMQVHDIVKYLKEISR